MFLEQLRDSIRYSVCQLEAFFVDFYLKDIYSEHKIKSAIITIGIVADKFYETIYVETDNDKKHIGHQLKLSSVPRVWLLARNKVQKRAKLDHKYFVKMMFSGKMLDYILDKSKFFNQYILPLPLIRKDVFILFADDKKDANDKLKKLSKLNRDSVHRYETIYEQQTPHMYLCWSDTPFNTKEEKGHIIKQFLKSDWRESNDDI